MQFLTNLIAKIGLLVFFLLLEIAAVYFMATRSDFHKNALGLQAMRVNGFFSEKVSGVKHYFNLPEENKSLIEENARLKNEIAKLPVATTVRGDSSVTRIDSLYKQKYTYKAAEIIDYSLRNQNNYFLLNKGKLDGVKEDMAVLSPNGVVGAVLNVSDHYASVLSVLHTKTNIKARIKGIERFGIIVWPGKDHRELSLTEIPKYLKVGLGDTIMTAGASAVYPEGTLIGKVSKIEPDEETGDWRITVRTFDDLAKVHEVYVVENLDKLDIEKAKAKENDVTE